ncbi:probable vacuolar protein sorting-associated protein 35 [Coccomyxa sp. Obi]|nr:probable vacuolar protein sorting-associated protein 35 [Coccomyxa sp. Obi]
MTPQEEQVKWLQDASNSVKRNAFYMKRALDEDNLREALRYSAAMLVELRTSLLTPQKYFELYMQAFDELRHLEVSRGLLPDTGSEYEGDGGDINDALEFLLLNFTEMNKLWVRMQHQGSGKDRERRESERQQLADLVGKNLTYISQLEGLDFKLYQEVVQGRMMEQVVSCKDEIAQQYLMQCIIQGFPDEFHLGTLPTLLAALPELQSGVKVHLVLASLLDRLSRFAATDASVVDQFNSSDAFGQLLAAATRVSEQHTEMPGADIAAMYIALANFVGAVYPDHLDYINRVLESCHEALAGHGDMKEDRTEKQIVALLTLPLNSYDPVTVLGLSTYPRVMSLLKPATCKAMAVKIVQTILKVGTEISEPAQVEMLLDFIAPLVADSPTSGDEDDEEDFEDEQGLVARLIHRLSAVNPAQHYALLQTARERFSAGGARRLRHTLPPIAFAALGIVHRLAAAPHADAPEPSPKEVLQFVHQCAAQLAEAGDSAEMALQLFLTAAQSASEHAHLEIIAYEFFEQAFILFEEAIPDSASERVALASITGALQRCRIFPPEPRATLVHKATGYSAKLLRKADQCRAVLACSHLYWQDAVDDEDVDHTTKGEGEERSAGAEAENGASPLADNEEDGSGPSALQPPVQDGEHVMMCLKRALKIAHAAQQQLAVALRSSDTLPAWLFVEILNHYLYYYDQGLTSISASVLQNLLELVANEMAGENCQADAGLVAFYNNTLAHIAAQKTKPEKASLYDVLQI